jgi:hypothetical protein
VLVRVAFQEEYWYPDDGGEVWVSGYYPVGEDGRFLSRDALPDDMVVTNVAGVTHRPEALQSGLAAPGAVLRLRPEPDNAHDPNAVAVQLEDGTPLGYVPRELAPLVAADWSAVVLRERRLSPRDPRTGLTVLLAHAPAVELASVG